MLIIDAFAFCRNREQQAGAVSLQELVRLRAECVSDEGAIEWSLVGGMSKEVNGYPVLHLSIHGAVQLECQRCLTPFVLPIKSDSVILLAKDEHAADQLDSLLQNDELDVNKQATEVLVGGKEFDVIALIEDEALLALPLSPKHEVCPGDMQQGALEKIKKTGKRESPFAVLKDQLVIEKSKN